MKPIDTIKTLRELSKDFKTIENLDNTGNPTYPSLDSKWDVQFLKLAEEIEKNQKNSLINTMKTSVIHNAFLDLKRNSRRKVKIEPDQEVKL